MRVLHVCLANFYIDGYGYQENIITKMHKLQGHDVYIIASTETYFGNRQIGYTSAGQYVSENNIPVTRLRYSRCFPGMLGRKLRVYVGFYDELVRVKPDIIFIHGCQFLSITSILRYIKEQNDVRVFVDNHADYINSAKNWFSKYFLHKVIYRLCSKSIEPYVERFWATLPIRERFMIEMYGVPAKKISLLELGADDTMFDTLYKPDVRRRVRAELGLEDEHFVVITGGKIDIKKNIHILVDAVRFIKSDAFRLIVFGTPDDEMQYLVDCMHGETKIIFLGWRNQKEIYDLLQAADLGVYPGTHSVLWEQSCGVGLPCVFRKWDEIQHVDLGGNCYFLEEITAKSIADYISRLINYDAEYREMRSIAEQKCVPHFSYYNIAKKAIGNSVCS